MRFRAETRHKFSHHAWYTTFCGAVLKEGTGGENFMNYKLTALFVVAKAFAFRTSIAAA